MIVLTLKPSPEAANLFEQNLRFGLKLIRHHKSSYSHDPGVLDEWSDQCSHPSRIHHRIVIRISNHLATGFEDRPVSGPVEARAWLRDVMNCLITLSYKVLGRIIIGSVVNDKYLQLGIIEKIQ
jgi:hypothetical protein